MRWNKKYNGSRESLAPKSHRPHTQHPNAHTEQELNWIRNLHRRNPNISVCEMYGKLRQEKAYSRHPGSLYRVFVRLMNAHGIDKDAVIAKSNTPELLGLRDEIYRSIRSLWVLHVQACSPQVYSLVDTLYAESFEKQGYDLGVFHSVGTILATQEDLAQRLDNSYGNGFSVFLAEAIFIYCFIQSLASNEEEQSTEKN